MTDKNRPQRTPGEPVPRFSRSDSQPHSVPPATRARTTGPSGPGIWIPGGRAQPTGEPVDQAGAATTTKSIRIERLKFGRQLGEGGQAKVFDLPSSPLVVAKQYSKDIPKRHVLEQLVAWPESLPPHDREVLSKQAAWPLHVVESGDDAAGILMQRAPESFQLKNKKLSELQFLYLADRSKKLGHPVPEPPTRLVILRSLAAILDIVHRRGISHGDISMRNVLWSTESPYAFLLDCDGAKFPGLGAALPYVSTPHWGDPRFDRGDIPAPDIESDRRAFALAFYRSYFMVRGYDITFGSINSVPTQPFLTPPLKRLLVRGLGETPRPTMQEWLPEIDVLISSGEQLADPDPESPKTRTPRSVPAVKLHTPPSYGVTAAPRPKPVQSRSAKPSPTKPALKPLPIKNAPPAKQRSDTMGKVILVLLVAAIIIALLIAL